MSGPERWLTDVHVIPPGGGPQESLCENGPLGSRWTINPEKATCPKCLAMRTTLRVRR